MLHLVVCGMPTLLHNRKGWDPGRQPLHVDVPHPEKPLLCDYRVGKAHSNRRVFLLTTRSSELTIYDFW